MKRIATVILICVFIIGCFVVPSFAMGDYAALGAAYGQGSAAYGLSTFVKDDFKLVFSYTTLNPDIVAGCFRCSKDGTPYLGVFIDKNNSISGAPKYLTGFTVTEDSYTRTYSQSISYSSTSYNFTINDNDYYFRLMNFSEPIFSDNVPETVYTGSSNLEILTNFLNASDTPSYSGEWWTLPEFNLGQSPIGDHLAANGYGENWQNYYGSASTGGVVYPVIVGTNNYFLTAEQDQKVYIDRIRTLDGVDTNLGLASYDIDNTYDNEVYYVDYMYGQGVVHDVDNNTPEFETLSDAIEAFKVFLEGSSDPVAPSYSRNVNVDEFLANTLISFGFSFSNGSDALAVAEAAWTWCTNPDNASLGRGHYSWDTDSFVSYCNAQSNNYLDWYNGYRVSSDVTNALYEFCNSNYSGSNLGSGTLAGYSVSLNSNYLPTGKSSDYQPGDSNIFGNHSSENSFVAAQTVTYFNGQYVSDPNTISLNQFLYSPSDVRSFIGYPLNDNSNITTVSNGTGVITDGNGDTVYDINLDFPSLDWLKSLIEGLFNLLTNLVTTISDLLSQILNGILDLFHDAFSGLSDFGQGIIDWITTLFSGLSDLIAAYLPNDIALIIVSFISLNIGLGLIKFVLGRL